MPKKKPWYIQGYFLLKGGLTLLVLTLTAIVLWPQAKQQAPFAEPPQNLMGWAGPEAAKSAWAELKGKFPKFAIKGEVKGSEGAKVYLWKSAISVTGNHLPTIRQEIGDCVGQGSKNGMEYALVADIAKGAPFEFKSIFQPYHYGYGRMVIGKGQIRGPDGSVGSWQADAVREAGFIATDFEGGMPEYSGRVSSQWAVRKPDAKYVAEGKRHTVATTAMVTTYEEVRDALANGYPIVICSDRGFAMQPRVDGGKHWGTPQGTWNHCLLPGTMVSTYPNPKRCEDVMIGDSVVGQGGQLNSVIEVKRNPFNANTSTIKVTGLPPFTATAGHPLLVYRPIKKQPWAKPSIALATYSSGKYAHLDTQKKAYENSMQLWMRACDVKPGDYVLTPSELKREPCEIPTWPTQRPNAKKPNALVVDDDIAFLFGYFIADGNSVRSHKISMVLPANSPDKKRLLAACDKLGVEGKVYNFGTFERLTVYSSIMANAFAGWFGESSETKRIPRFLLTEGWNWKALLDGYCAGDGCEIKSQEQGRSRITTVSKTLANQIWLMAVSMKMYPTMYEITARSDRGYANAKDATAVQFGREPTRKDTMYWRGYYCMPVKSNELGTYAGAVYNYDVSGDDSFVAGGIANHNCMCLIGIDDTAKGPTFAGNRSGKKGAAYCLNSWGPDAHGQPADDAPPGGFWISRDVIEYIVRQEDSFAYSGVNGFVAAPPEWDFGFSLAQ